MNFDRLHVLDLKKRYKKGILSNQRDFEGFFLIGQKLQEVIHVSALPQLKLS
jgi:hypothetical protein